MMGIRPRRTNGGVGAFPLDGPMELAGLSVIPITATQALTAHFFGGIALVNSAAACVLTLPPPVKNAFIIVFNGADQDLTINTHAADLMKVYNDLDADGIAFTTGSQKIGAAVLLASDGNFWLAMPMGANTMTVTT